MGLPPARQSGIRSMTTRIEEPVDTLISALRAARRNAERWMEMSPESIADSEQLEQWTNIARLRRGEVERIETLLAAMADHPGSPQSGRFENIVSGYGHDVR